MDAIALGLIATVVGTFLAAYGTRAFYLVLPVFGFVAGFLIGGQAMTWVLGEGMLASALGWIAGIVVGVVLALAAGLWWYAAVVILTASLGYELGSGLLVMVGVDPGVLTFAVGLALAALLVVLAIALDAPTLYVAALTAFGGAAYGVAGAYVIVGQVSIAQLQDGPIGALTDHPIGFVAWLGLGAVAFGFQYLDLRRIRFERIDRASFPLG